MEKLVERAKRGNAKRGYHTHHWQNIKTWRRPGLTSQKGTRLRNGPSELCSLQHHVLQLLPAQPELPLQLLLQALRALQLLWHHPARGLQHPCQCGQLQLVLRGLLQWQWEGDHAVPERPAGQLPGEGAAAGAGERGAGEPHPGEEPAAGAPRVPQLPVLLPDHRGAPAEGEGVGTANWWAANQWTIYLNLTYPLPNRFKFGQT